jgi:transposase-like protein
MKQYTAAFKARVLQRLVGPTAISAHRLAADVGVSQVTLSRWLAAARSVPSMATSTKKWTGAQKLRVMLAAHGLSDTDVGALLRREGLHAAQVDDWRTAAETTRWTIRMGGARRPWRIQIRNVWRSSSVSCGARIRRWPKRRR